SCRLTAHRLTPPRSAALAPVPRLRDAAGRRRRPGGGLLMRAASIHLGIALFILVLCVPGVTAAAPIAVTIKGGLSAATLHGNLPTDPFVENGTRLGLGGGLSVAIGMRGRFTLQPEMLYVMKGT